MLCDLLRFLFIYIEKGKFCNIELLLRSCQQDLNLFKRKIVYFKFVYLNSGVHLGRKLRNLVSKNSYVKNSALTECYEVVQEDSYKISLIGRKLNHFAEIAITCP